MTFLFRESLTNTGGKYYWPHNKEARELLDFMGSPYLIGEAKMDKIWNWVGKLGHEIYIEDMDRGRSEEDDFYFANEFGGKEGWIEQEELRIFG